MFLFLQGSKRTCALYFVVKRLIASFLVMNACQLDVLPVELLHNIFGYLSTYDILNGFYGVSEYINTIILGYHQYSCQFRSIDRTQFDFICRLIRPDQITSLRLADLDDTPDQSKLFFTRFKIEQCINLRSLDLENMTHDTFDQMIHISKLKTIILISFTTMF